ncbi:MAG TPA: DUF3592 domain-containing protein [Ktedonobacterales bacterium]|jgi:hypothetical protein
MQQLFYMAFFVILIVVIGGAILRGAQVSGLRQTGMRIAATVRDIDHQRHTTTNPTTHVMSTRDDWDIEAEWTDPASGESRLFRSDRLDEWDAERYPVGSPITVLIDPQNPDSYYVEIAR